MGWFDSQLKERKKNDDALYEQALAEIANAVSGRRVISVASSSNTTLVKAANKIIEYWNFKPVYTDIDNINKLTGRRTPIDSGEERADDADAVLQLLMHPHGIMYRRIKLEQGWHRDANGPILARLRSDGSYIALLPRRTSGYSYYNEEKGRNVKIKKAEEELFEADAMMFFRPLPQRELRPRDCAAYIMRSFSATDLIMAVLLLAAAALVGMLMPKINYFMLTEVLQSGYMNIFGTTVTFMLCLSVTKVILLMVQVEASKRVDVKLSTSVRSALMMRILSLPSSFFRQNSSGELYRHISEVGEACSAIMESAITVIFSALFSMLYVIQIFRFAPSLVAPSMVAVVLTLIISLLSAYAQTGVDSRRMHVESKESAMLHSTISGMRKIKLTGSEKRIFAKWAMLYADKIKYPPAITKMSSVIILAITLTVNAVIYVTAVKTDVAVADYYAFNTAYGMVSAVFVSLAGAAVTLAHGRSVYDMIRPVLETAPENTEKKKPAPDLRGNIEFNNVSFRYSETSPYTIEDMSFRIRQGEYVAIVGRSGCGKSTLVRLMLGFEKPQRGTINYDNRDMDSFDLRSLRARIGTVLQHGRLFAGSIFTNITIYAPWMTVDDAWKAAEIAGIADDIRRMPMGMHTLVSENSGGFSGGQKQRLMIARALLPLPKILIFDEATSALDNITQKKISDALDSLKCTRIVVAHRLSTIKNCDRIIVIDQGRIAEDGSYDELISRNGIFAELVENQRIDI